jgi:hypothetical protein
LACGSDILFAEAMAETNAQVTIYLPFGKEDFLKTSVAFAGDHWVNRFNELVKKYPVKIMTTERYDGNAELFSFHGTVLLGTTLLRSQMLHAEAGLISVLSQTNREVKSGGTRDMSKIWPSQHKAVNINPDEFNSALHTIERGTSSGGEPQPSVRPIRFLLQALVEGMKNEEIEYIITRLVKSDPPLIEEPQFIKIDVNSMLAIFTSARGTMNFAQLLSKSIAPESIRMILHAGPVTIEDKDGLTTVTGTTHKEINLISNHALSSLTYCSEQVAAILVLDRQDLLFHPVGKIEVVDDQKDIEVFTIDLMP